MSINPAAIALVSLLVWFFVHKVTKPLQHLRAGVEAIGKGHFSRQVGFTLDTVTDGALSLKLLRKMITTSWCAIERCLD